jgi:hypothetical protein
MRAATLLLAPLAFVAVASAAPLSANTVSVCVTSYDASVEYFPDKVQSENRREKPMGTAIRRGKLEERPHLPRNRPANLNAEPGSFGLSWGHSSPDRVHQYAF